MRLIFAAASLQLLDWRVLFFRSITPSLRRQPSYFHITLVSDDADFSQPSLPSLWHRLPHAGELTELLVQVLPIRQTPPPSLCTGAAIKVDCPIVDPTQTCKRWVWTRVQALVRPYLLVSIGPTQCKRVSWYSSGLPPFYSCANLAPKSATMYSLMRLMSH